MLPLVEACYRCENAKSLGSKITSVPVESAELLNLYRANSNEEKDTRVCCWREDLSSTVAGGVSDELCLLSCFSLSVHMVELGAKLTLACWSTSDMPYLDQMLDWSHQRYTADCIQSVLFYCYPATHLNNVLSWCRRLRYAISTLSVCLCEV